MTAIQLPILATQQPPLYKSVYPNFWLQPHRTSLTCDKYMEYLHNLSTLEQIVVHPCGLPAI